MWEPRDIPKVYSRFLLFFLVTYFVIYLYALVYIERVISYYNYVRTWVYLTMRDFFYNERKKINKTLINNYKREREKLVINFFTLSFTLLQPKIVRLQQYKQTCILIDS